MKIFVLLMIMAQPNGIKLPIYVNIFEDRATCERMAAILDKSKVMNEKGLLIPYEQLVCEEQKPLKFEAP